MAALWLEKKISWLSKKRHLVVKFRTNSFPYLSSGSTSQPLKVFPLNLKGKIHRFPGLGPQTVKQREFWFWLNEVTKLDFWFFEKDICELATNKLRRKIPRQRKIRFDKLCIVFSWGRLNLHSMVVVCAVCSEGIYNRLAQIIHPNSYRPITYLPYEFHFGSNTGSIYNWLAHVTP